MKEVSLSNLTAEDLMSLIDDGERFYVCTEKSNVLPYNPNADRDAFWFTEAPCASKPIRGIIESSR